LLAAFGGDEARIPLEVALPLVVALALIVALALSGSGAGAGGAGSGERFLVGSVHWAVWCALIAHSSMAAAPNIICLISGSIP
jgi:hypothetical protein